MIILAGLALAPNAGASCAGELAAKTLRDLRIRPDAESFLTGKPDSLRLMQSLTRVLTTLQDPVAGNSVAIALVDQPPDEIPAECAQNPFFASHQDRRTSAALAVCANLVGGWNLAGLSEYDLGLMSHLLQSFSRSMPAPYLKPGEGKTTGSKSVTISRVIVEKVLMNKSMRPAFLVLAQNIDKLPNASAFEIANQVDLPNLLERLRSDRRLHTSDITYIGMLFMKIVILARDTYGQKASGPLANEDTFWRRSLLDAIEKYLSTNMQVRTNLDDLVNIVDQLFFRAQNPPTSAFIFKVALESAKSLAGLIKADLPAVTGAAPPALRDVTPFVLRLEDMFVPRGSVYLRERTAADEEAAELTSDEEIERMIRTDASNPRSLRAFVSRKPISEMAAGETYDFWFARESRPVPMSIRFSSTAIRWMTENPTQAQAFLEALTMGRARAFGQNGVKQITSSRDDLFEVKIFGSDRLLIVRDGRTWEALRVVDKTNFDRVVRSL